MKLEPFVTGTGQFMQVHDASECSGEHCPIHKPSDHPLRDEPLYWREDRGIMERLCECGVGHPDPDGIEHIQRTRGDEAAWAEGIHGCCGCCMAERDGKVGT